MRWLLAIVLFGGTAVVLGHDWLGIGGPGFDDIAGGELYDAVVVAAAIACLLRARAVPRERAAWLLFGAAVVCWAAGEIYWTAFILDAVEPPYPSGADALYLAFYPLACAGLVLLVRARAHELDWRRWSDATIAALGTASLGAAFVFDYVAARTTGTGIEVATSLAYPLGDIVLLALIVGVIALTDWRPGRTWVLLLLGLSFTVVADVAYSIQGVGGVVPAGNWIDPIYMLSAAALGAVLWAPVAAPIRAADQGGRWRELMVPGLLAVVMVGLFAMQVLSARGGLAAILWGATMVAVVVRLAISVRENQRLVEQVRTDSLTGIGNRGAMQLDIEAHCAGASERRPIALYLFDRERVQALQRHLRPPGRRRDAHTPRRAPARRRGRGRLGIPDRRRRVLRPALLRPGALRRRRQAGGRSADRKRPRRRRVLLLGRGDDPARGGRARGGAGAGRPAHVRAEGVAPDDPRRERRSLPHGAPGDG